MNNAKNNPENNAKWNVTFQQDESVVKVFTDIHNLETAVKLSLSLHEASNANHSIYVMHDDIIDIVFTRH